MSSFVQINSKEFGGIESSDSVPFGVNNTLNNIYIVFVMWQDTGGFQDVTVTDTNGNTLTRVLPTLNGGGVSANNRLSEWWAKNINVGANTVHFNWTGNVQNPKMFIIEYVPPTSPVLDIPACTLSTPAYNGFNFTVNFNTVTNNELCSAFFIVFDFSLLTGNDPSYAQRFNDNIVGVEDRVSCPLGGQSVIWNANATCGCNPPLGGAGTVVVKSSITATGLDDYVPRVYSFQLDKSDIPTKFRVTDELVSLPVEDINQRIIIPTNEIFQIPRNFDDDFSGSMIDEVSPYIYPLPTLELFQFPKIFDDEVVINPLLLYDYLGKGGSWWPEEECRCIEVELTSPDYNEIVDFIDFERRLNQENFKETQLKTFGDKVKALTKVTKEKRRRRNVVASVFGGTAFVIKNTVARVSLGVTSLYFFLTDEYTSGLSPEQQAMFDSAIRNLHDSKLLIKLASEFENKNFDRQAQLLKRRANLLQMSKEDKKKYHQIYVQAMASNDKQFISRVAKAFEQQGALFTSKRLYARIKEIQ